jgi:hypothetical protein
MMTLVDIHGTRTTMACLGRHYKTKFTFEEDSLLTRLVTDHRHANWKQIALMMGTRNARQCRERWQNYLNPDLSQQHWTREDDILLQQKVQEHGVKWHTISSFFQNRAPIFLRNRWQRIERRLAKSELCNRASDPADTEDTPQLPVVSSVTEQHPPPAQSPFNVLDFFDADVRTMDDRGFDPWNCFQF